MESFRKLKLWRVKEYALGYPAAEAEEILDLLLGDLRRLDEEVIRDTMTIMSELKGAKKRGFGQVEFDSLTWPLP